MTAPNDHPQRSTPRQPVDHRIVRPDPEHVAATVRAAWAARCALRDRATGRTVALDERWWERFRLEHGELGR